MEIIRRFTFEAGHRLLHYNGKCANLHGHSYQGALFAAGMPKPESGMIVDFTDLKDILNSVIDRFDHSFIVNPSDFSMMEFLEKEKSKCYVMGSEILQRRAETESSFENMKGRWDVEPTAENIAHAIVRLLNVKISSDSSTKIVLHRLLLKETENNGVIVPREDEPSGNLEKMITEVAGE